MQKLRVLVDLRSQTKAFNIGPEAFTEIFETFSELEFEFLKGPQRLVDYLEAADIVICWSFKEEYYVKAKKLKAIYTPAAGRDWVAQDPENQIPVHFSSFHGPMIAETLLGMILFFNNSILSFQVNQRLAEWNPNTDYPRTLLRNQHVVILGYGHIGRYCAKLLGSLGPSITGIKRNISGIFDSETGVRYARLENAAMDFAKADHLVVLLPSGEDTNGLVNSNVLNQLKPGCTIYNFGRGTAVNESDLITALDSGHLSAAGLDVFAKEPLPLDSPLWSHPKVLVFPHSSCCYQEYGNLFTLELKEKLRSLLIHQKIINPFG